METDVLIVGAGFAGLSTAYHLCQSFSGSILVVDQEEIPGSHASGRNASLILQSTEIPEIRRAVVLSRQFYEANREALGFQPCGSLLLGGKSQLEHLRENELVASQFRDAAALSSEIPLLSGHHFEAALWTPSDGVIDIAALLQHYLGTARASGATLLLNCQVKEICRNGAYRVETTQGIIQATSIVNAAGAWAPRLARMAGARSLPLTPLKRHLFVLGNIAGVEPPWPFVWNIERNFYFRPEVGDLLFSICDEEQSESLNETVSSDVESLLAELIWKELPALRHAVPRRAWSCFRAKTGDGRFIIGWDPDIENFFWVAGLGGHGVGASWQVGRLAAARLLGSKLEGADAFNPARFENVKAFR